MRLAVKLSRADGIDAEGGVAGEEGGKLRVTGGQGQNQVTLDVVAGNDGKYKADFGAQYDIVAPANGGVTLTNAEGHQFITGWSAVQMTMTLDGANVVGNGRWFDSYVDGLAQGYLPSTGGQG